MTSSLRFLRFLRELHVGCGLSSAGVPAVLATKSKRKQWTSAFGRFRLLMNDPDPGAKIARPLFFESGT